MAIMTIIKLYISVSTAGLDEEAPRVNNKNCPGIRDKAVYKSLV